MRQQRKKAFTLVEAMVALAVGSLVLGAAALLYKQGVSFFYKTTEHAAFREESLLCMEHIARDLEQLMVSDGQINGNGEYHLVKPYELTGAATEFTRWDPVTKTNKPTGTQAYDGIKFMRYHSTETDAQGQPLLIGRMIEYSVKPVSGNPLDGKNLYRNGDTRPINKIPLREIAFVRENNKVTADQIGASPHAVLTVMIVPMGGSWVNPGGSQNMTQDTVDRLRADKALVTRTFHLAGYETYYTLILNEAFRMQANAAGDPTITLGGVYKAVLDDAKATLSPAQFTAVQARFQTGSASSAPNFKNVQLFKMEWNTKFEDSTAGQDKFFSNLPVQEGAKPTATGAAGGGATGGGGEGGEGEGG